MGELIEITHKHPIYARKERKALRIILIGFGNVGQAFTQVITLGRGQLLQQHGIRPHIIAILDSHGAVVDNDGLDLDRIIKIKRELRSVSKDEKSGLANYTANSVIKTLDADVIIEATPTNLKTGEPGLSHIRTALMQKQHVITVNKGPLALAFLPLHELASRNHRLLRFSGTVGGGTPILNLGKTGLSGDHIHSIRGVLNGTTNYVLSRMTDAGISQTAAIKEAQLAGFAEADPQIDIEGFDSGAKLAILANYILEQPLTINDIDITGINDISLKDIQYATKKHHVIKLIASVNNTQASVKPQALPIKHPLNVSGVLNAVTYSTECQGDITISGKGAGGSGTAGAIIRDLIDIHQYTAEAR
jgi:homoserine dehydrogenase